MNGDALIDIPLLKQFDPELFTTCGRALYLAQHFERNLRSVIAALDLRMACTSGDVSPSDEETTEMLYEKGLKRGLGRSLTEGLPRHVPNWLKEDFGKRMQPQLSAAREARNRIAHEMLFGIEGIDVRSGDFEDFIERLREDVRTLAKADFSVCCIIQGFNNEPVPSRPESYVEDIVKWVFGPIDGLLQ
jgi:hypothetical protein